MNFTAVLFSAALLLYNAATFGDFFPVEEIDNPAKKATAAVFGPNVAARTIYNDIRTAAPGIARKQFGFLYLHDGNCQVSYVNQAVKNAIKAKTLDTKIDARVRPPFWPTNLQKTNILIALPDKKANPNDRELNNHGHSEHKMLEQLDNLRAEFEKRNRFQDKCPKYIILGTYLAPCYDDRTPRRFGCAQDYVEAKNEFNQGGRCSTTRFYLYVPDPRQDQFWRDTQTLMARENIDIINGV